MKTLVVALFLILFPALSMCFQDKNERPHSVTIVYELYSWQQISGQWCFSILTMTDRAKTAEDIFDKRQTIYGTAKLKQNISKMPRNTQLVWMKNPWEGTSVKGTESVVWPPDEIMNEVKRFAATRHVEVTWQK
jgi:hypothetical protein